MRTTKAGKVAWVFGLLAVAVLVLAVPAKADIVTPGSTGTPDLFTVPFNVIADTGTLDWSAATMSGQAETLVVSDPGNTFCAGCLDFLFAVFINTTSTDGAERITLSSFTGFQTDVGIASNIPCVSGPNVDPGTVDRSLNGSVVGFNFGAANPVGAGDCTAALVVETNATSFGAGALNVIDGSVATIASYAPVPEPASLALLATGLVGLVGIRRRRKQA